LRHSDERVFVCFFFTAIQVTLFYEGLTIIGSTLTLPSLLGFLDIAGSDVVASQWPTTIILKGRKDTCLYPP
jgi:hypothetical protein